MTAPHRLLSGVVLLGSVALLAQHHTATAQPAGPPARAPTTPTPTSTPPAPNSKQGYRDPTLSVEARVADLLRRMTAAEKVAQLAAVNWEHTYLDDAKTHQFSPTAARNLMRDGIGEITRPSDRQTVRGSVELANAIQKFLLEETRLGVPALLHEEALHGFVATGGTSFPQAIALAATFDPQLVEAVFTVTARQTRARGVQHVLAPVLDVARDPRWGRIEETYGEDPYLVTRMGVAATLGFQGRRAAGAPIDADHVMATAKHFTAHGTPEGGRNTAPGNYSPHVVREVFLPPFERAVHEANIESVMASYNELDGVPSHANRWLLRNLLRDEWRFPGLVVSDYFGVAELERKHHVVADLAGAGRAAIEAGVELELPEAEGYKQLVDDLRTGKVSARTVDQAVAHVLRAKFLLGLFEHPFVDVSASQTERPTDRALALKAAEEAIVLLKNEGGLLPLDATRIKSIAVIGPNASVCRLGGYSGGPDRPLSVVEGLKAKLGARVKVSTAAGCGLTVGGRGWKDDKVELSSAQDDDRLIREAAALAATADVNILVLGQNEQLSREGWADNHRGDRLSLDLVGKQMELARAVLAAGRPTVLLLIHGSPLSIPELARTVPAILDGFYLGEETGTAVANVLFGDAVPAGRLPVSIPRSTGSVPMYYNYKPSARRLYLSEEPGPQWAFGFGLSYTTFRYDPVSIRPARIARDGHATASVTVTNTGKRAGDEIVQLYLHDVVSSVTRPVQELKGFKRIHLGAGESKRVELSIGPDALALFDANMARVVEPGRFEVMMGGSSDQVQRATLEVVENP